MTLDLESIKKEYQNNTEVSLEALNDLIGAIDQTIDISMKVAQGQKLFREILTQKGIMSFPSDTTEALLQQCFAGINSQLVDKIIAVMSQVPPDSPHVCNVNGMHTIASDAFKKNNLNPEEIKVPKKGQEFTPIQLATHNAFEIWFRNHVIAELTKAGERIIESLETTTETPYDHMYDIPDNFLGESIVGHGASFHPALQIAVAIRKKIQGR